MNSSKLDLLISRLMSLAQQPELLIMITFGVPIILFCSSSKKYRWWTLALWAFFLPMNPLFDWRGTWIVPPFPFNQLVTHARHISLFMLILFLPAAFRFRNRNPNVKVPPALLGLLIMNLVYCLRYIPTPELEIALLRLGTYITIFYFLALSLPRWITDRRELYRYLSAAGFATFAFIAISLVCYLMRPSAVTAGGRLTGLTQNANQLGALCGYTLPVVLGLSLSPSLKIRTRYFWLFVAALIVVIVIWSGSRTSLGMCAIGVAIIFRAKIGRLLIAGIPIALFAWLLFYLLEDSQSGAERMTSLKNTRINEWIVYFEMWKKDLVFGNAKLEMRVIENSYLALAANAGFAGCMAIFLFLVLTAKTCFKLVRTKMMDRDGQILRDVALAGIGAALGNSVFEATLLSSLSSNAFWVFLYFILADAVHRVFVAAQSMDPYQAAQYQYQITGQPLNVGYHPRGNP